MAKHKEKSKEKLKSAQEKALERETEQKKAVPETVEILKTEHEALTQKSKELEELKDRFLRSAADFENAKKRLTKEREDFFKFALEGLISDLLHVLDNFERALAHIPEDPKTKGVRDGFVLIQKQLMTTLGDRQLMRLETVGKPFDPHLHDAVGHVESEEHPEGAIVEELLAGYQLNGKLIRPAKVKVTSRPKADKDEKGAMSS